MTIEVDNMIYGFRLLEKRFIEEVNSTGWLFEHEKSGAKLYFLENEDDNKVFSISFRTPPQDHTGLPHILEHSVLCGSRKFPVKEPFVELAKGSLNTFLNAMTYPDKTVYPVASRNDQDFRNLMDVYLDAVFYPNIYTYPEIFMQEGWHYDLENANDELTYKGVVYNEMKGAFSSPESLLFRKIREALFPDTPYGFESGGNPDEIPELTLEQFLAFHQKYYHPSNSYIFLYGKMDISQQLQFLDGEYLSKFQRIKVDSALPLQNPFTELKEKVLEYPITPNEKEENKSFLSLSFVTGLATDPELYLAFQILKHLLLDTSAAPLKRALLDAGLGDDVFGLMNQSLLQPTFSIVVKGSNEGEKGRFQEVVYSTLQRLVDEGIDKKLIESSINITEFQLREADMRGYPKGLIYGIQSMDSWLYDQHPALHLEYEGTLAKVKSALTTPYFEKIISEYILNNRHASLLIVKPKKGLAEAKEVAIREKLAAYKASLSDQEIQELVDQTKRLLERQNTPDSPEQLETIPLLSLADLDPKVEELPLVEKIEDGVKVLHHDLFTNRIAYVNLYFDTRGVPQELLPYVSLLAGVLGETHTRSYSFQDLSNEMNLHTGGITFSVETYSKLGTDQEYVPKLLIKSKALVDNLPKLFHLLGEVTGHSRFDDQKRLKEIIGEMKSRLEMTMINHGHLTAVTRALSYFSPVGKYIETVKGLSFYQFLVQLSSQFDTSVNEISDNLKKVAELIFNRQQLLISVTCEGDDYQSFQSHLPILLEELGEESVPMLDYSFSFTTKNEGLLTSAKVQYVAKASHFGRLGYTYSGHLQVLKTIIGLDYLWTRVRVKGGAYGGFGSFDRSGHLFFASYRDPNLKETLAVYDEAADYLNQFSATEREMTKYIIGTISNLDDPLTPSMKGERATAYYLSGVTREDLQREREEVLSTTVEVIRSFAPLVSDGMRQNIYCVLGNEEKLKEHQDLFHELKSVFE